MRCADRKRADVLFVPLNRLATYSLFRANDQDQGMKPAPSSVYPVFRLAGRVCSRRDRERLYSESRLALSRPG
jgi:hypothetical protein